MRFMTAEVEMTSPDVVRMRIDQNASSEVANEIRRNAALEARN
jgi:hypothetical protein